jgi:hypothetical protein
MSWLEVVLRLAVALACGATIGIERQYRQHSAALEHQRPGGHRVRTLRAGDGPHPQRVEFDGGRGEGSSLGSASCAPGSLSGTDSTFAGGVAQEPCGALPGSGCWPGRVSTWSRLWARSWCWSPTCCCAPWRGFSIGMPPRAGPLGRFQSTISCARCVSQQENHIRSLLLQGVSGRDLTLLALQSADTPDPGRIEVCADRAARRDARMRGFSR